MNQSDQYSNTIRSKSKNPSNSRNHLSFSRGGYHTPNSHERTSDLHTMGLTQNHSSVDASKLVYGTTIKQKQAAEALKAFILQYQTSVEVDGIQTMQKIYFSKLADLDLSEKYVLDVDGRHLKEYDNQLYYQFIYFPTQMILIFDQIIKQIYHDLFLQNIEDPDVQARKLNKRDSLMIQIIGLHESISLRQLNQKHINKLISIRGIVIRTSQINPEMLTAVFKCINCQCRIVVELVNAKIQQPKVCNVCKMRQTLEIIHNQCRFTDKQFVKFQELPEYVPEGQTPSSITLITHNHNVDALRPGDRVQIVGIYRVSESKIQKNLKILRAVYNTYLDAISYGRITDKNLKILDENINQIAFNDNDKNLFIQMASQPTIISDLIKSFAPSIYGHQEVKKGLLSQLFGGTKKDFDQLGRGRFRSDINICLIGDPSTAKSQLIQQVHKISPRGIYTSGKGSSAVGLTANVRRDPQTKQFVLQSGALVLSDLGICCIDQFDKMDPNSRLILLQAMEQQTISIAKAGIVCQLNSRTAVLCAANPVHSRYNPKKSVIQNINLEPALLSRFDLIYILLDQPQQNFDRKLGNHILSLYAADQFDKMLNLRQRDDNVYSKEVLTKYITYAKQYIHPVLDQQAADKLVQAYTDMRRLGNSKKVITATTRQLESLIRVSQSFAKMRLSSHVQIRDVQQAIALVKFATQQAATDPTTGLIDMDVIVTGKTAATRRKVNKIKQIIFELLKANLGRYKKTSTIEGIKPDVDKRLDIGQRASQDEIVEALRLLESEGIVALYGPSKGRPNFRTAKDLPAL